MQNPLRIALAQLNFLVGDIEGNAQKIIQAIHTARDTHHAHLIVFPELALTGYPPEDLLYRADLYERIAQVLPSICDHATGIDVILGYPTSTKTARYNQASFIHNQKITQHYDKQNLPNYGVFDEMRYFNSGDSSPCIINLQEIKIAIVICEDLWHPEPITQAKSAGAELVVGINASPFSISKAEHRQEVLQNRIAENALPILYLNCVGGQDELLFDGGSMVLDQKAKCVQQAAFFEEDLLIVDIEKDVQHNVQIKSPAPVRAHITLTEEEKIYKALVLGVHDYVKKNNFSRVLLGLSGGIDSALTLAIAVDALSKDNVQAIIMPSRHSADISVMDAKQQAEAMGVHYEVLSIEPTFQAFLETLKPVFQNKKEDITEENLQARCRGMLLMAIANKQHALVLTTSNKSETAVGYSTLYGDMAGGFCVLKDVLKTTVYRLARYRNTLSSVIPDRVITRAPSAELSPNQTDEESLAPYAILDEILVRYIEQAEGFHKIVAAGFDKEVVRKILQLVDRNEYKRRQAPPGTRIAECAFGKDRRYPITSGFGVK